MYELTNEELKKAYERFAKTDGKNQALMSACIELAANADIPPLERVKQIQSLLIAAAKLEQEATKHKITTGQLVDIKTAIFVAEKCLGVMFDLMRKHLPDSDLHFLADSFAPALYDAAKEDESLRVFMDMEASSKKFEGEPRARLTEKIQHDRELNLRREKKLLT